MGSYRQAERGLRIDTPLGPDALLLVGLSGREYLSRPFTFELELLADNKQTVPFEKLLGQRVTVHVLRNDGGTRHVNGICVRLTQGDKHVLDDARKTFTAYSMEVVPEMWRMTRRSRSRIFQHLTVPEILRKVFSDYRFKVSYGLQGPFHPRDYCVQYRETDFNFVSRMMEEEGISYFFRHFDGDHELVVSNTHTNHPDLPGPDELVYEQSAGVVAGEDRVYDWRKSQELRSGKVALWDHTFELPHKHLETEWTTLHDVPVGSVSHLLSVADNESLEVFDWPGEYAQRFDGVDKGGGERPEEMQKVFEERERVIKIRMKQEETGAIVARAGSNAAQMTAGHRFRLVRHFNANGRYLVYAVLHTAREMTYRTDGEAYQYQNRIVCLPDALPFVPPLTTPWPTAKGTQSAVVVGPAGEEIFTDRYGRVKVQFHWDREGKGNEDSSCWIRVASTWAGRQWGAIQIPRIGQEVVVAFEEGDPDKPIIVGSVYNADMMPPYRLPESKTQSGFRSRSSLQGGPQNYNELRFEDRKGEEEIHLHAERTLTTVVEGSESRDVGGDRTTAIGDDDTLEVKSDLTVTAGGQVTIKSGSGAAQLFMDGGGSVTFSGNGSLDVNFGGTVSISATTVRIVVSKEVDVHAPKINLSAVTVECSGLLKAEVVTAELVKAPLIAGNAVKAEVVKATGSVASPSFVPL